MTMGIMHHFNDRLECGCGRYANRSVPDDGGACTCGLDGAEGCMCTIADDPSDCTFVARKTREAWERRDDEDTPRGVAEALHSRYPETDVSAFECEIEGLA